MINIPNETKQWKQANNSDLFGNIAVTKNINFDQEGYLKLSNSSRAAMHSSIDADFDVPAVMLFNEDYGGYFTETWDNAFAINQFPLSDYPTQITDAGVPSGDSESDAVMFGDKMIVTQDTDVDYYDMVTNAWVDTNISLTASGQHPVANFLSLNAVAIANVNTVGLYAFPFSATPSLITTLTILSDFEITSMCYHNQNLYIGTRNKNGGHAYMYVWNGSGSAAQSHYKVDSNIIFSMCAHKGSVVLLAGNGELLRFNGGGFTTLDAFPIYYTDRSLIDYLNIGMYKNIMKSNGDLIYILFTDNGNSTRKLLNQPDGVWCYDDKVGLHHRYSLSNSLVKIQHILDTDVDPTTDIITVTTPAVSTGTEVYYRAGATLIGGLTDETKYFVIKVDATHIKLATTKANALAGTSINLTSSGVVGQSLVFFPNIDYGAFYTGRTMSMCLLDFTSSSPQYGTDLLWGGEVDLRTKTGDDSLLGTTTGYVESRGYFITPKIFSNNITDTFNRFSLKYSKLMTELDKIIIKFRTTDDRLDEINLSNSANWLITWTSTNTFTTIDTHWANAVVGDEVEVLNGAAGGLLAHITEITLDAGTYTVTIDETFDQYITGDVSQAVFRNWKKFDTIDWTNTDGFYAKDIDMTGKFLQLKIELRGIGTRIEQIKVDNKYSLPSSL